MYEEGKVGAADLVGAFILTYLCVRHKKPFISGKPLCFGEPVHIDESWSKPITSFPGLIELISVSYLRSTLGTSIDLSRIRLSDIFLTCRLRGVNKNNNDFVNSTLIEWMRGKRPFVLMFRIPSPMEVLRMQACGQRVVTMLTSLDELSSKHTAKLHYMEDGRFHSRDALDFLIHDLAHMEKFVDESTHREQVGFVRCMLRLGDGSPQQELRSYGGDLELWHEVEYCISDMNCWGVLLLQYLRAKWLRARTRLGPAVRMEEGWAAILRAFAMPPGSPVSAHFALAPGIARFLIRRRRRQEATAATAIGSRPLTTEEMSLLRAHLAAAGGGDVAT